MAMEDDDMCYASKKNEKAVSGKSDRHMTDVSGTHSLLVVCHRRVCVSVRLFGVVALLN
jgi:hypothetical protein